jgi:hypothetical protein
MHPDLHNELSRQLHANVLAEAKRDLIASAQPRERHATHRLRRLFQALRPTRAPRQRLRPAVEPT